MIDIPGTSYSYDESQEFSFRRLSDRVHEMRATGKLSPDVLYLLRKFFRIKNIHHSNAIEGNVLEVGGNPPSCRIGTHYYGEAAQRPGGSAQSVACLRFSGGASRKSG